MPDLDLSIPAADLEKAERIVAALLEAFRPLQRSIPAGTDMWNPE